jgi:hypothetical protein
MVHEKWYRRLLKEVRRQELRPRRDRWHARVIKQKMSKWKEKRPEHLRPAQPTKAFRDVVVLLAHEGHPVARAFTGSLRRGVMVADPPFGPTGARPWTSPSPTRWIRAPATPGSPRGSTRGHRLPAPPSGRPHARPPPPPLARPRLPMRPLPPRPQRLHRDGPAGHQAAAGPAGPNHPRRRPGRPHRPAGTRARLRPLGVARVATPAAGPGPPVSGPDAAGRQGLGGRRGLSERGGERGNRTPMPTTRHAAGRTSDAVTAPGRPTGPRSAGWSGVRAGTCG